MSENFYNPEVVDVRRLGATATGVAAAATVAATITALAATVVSKRVVANQASVDRILALLQLVADTAAEMHL